MSIFQESSSETKLEMLEISGEIRPENPELERLRCVKLENRPNLAEIEDPLKLLKARLILCK